MESILSKLLLLVINVKINRSLQRFSNESEYVCIINSNNSNYIFNNTFSVMSYLDSQKVPPATLTSARFVFSSFCFILLASGPLFLLAQHKSPEERAYDTPWILHAYFLKTRNNTKPHFTQYILNNLLKPPKNRQKKRTEDAEHDAWAGTRCPSIPQLRLMNIRVKKKQNNHSVNRCHPKGVHK